MTSTADYTHESSYFVNVRIGLHQGAFQVRSREHAQRAYAAEQRGEAFDEPLPQPFIVEVIVFDGKGWNTLRTDSAKISPDEREYVVSADLIRSGQPELAASLDGVVRGLEVQRQQSAPEGVVIVEGRETARHMAWVLLQSIIDGPYMDVAHGEAQDIQLELTTAELPSWV